VNNPEMSTLEMEDKQVTVEPPRPLNWIPDQLGWHYSIFRKSFKKTPMLKIFKRFLTVESEIVSFEMTRDGGALANTLFPY
jgi:hypothetical protein